MHDIDFNNAVKREVFRLDQELGLVDAPEFSRAENSFVIIAYRSKMTLLSFYCELQRGYGVDVLFAADSQRKKAKQHSVHTFLRLYEPAAAMALGHALPKNQEDMDEILRLFANALLKHRKAFFDATEATITSIEKDLVERDLANQRFRPTGRFC